MSRYKHKCIRITSYSQRVKQQKRHKVWNKGIKTMQLLILTIYSNERLYISCQKHIVDSLLLSSRCKTNYMKNYSLLHAHFTGELKDVENLFLENAYSENFMFWNDICCRYTLWLPLCIGYRSYITIIKELNGTSAASEPLNFFIIVIYNLWPTYSFLLPSH